MVSLYTHVQLITTQIIMMTVCLAQMVSHLVCITLNVLVRVLKSVYRAEEWEISHTLASAGGAAVLAGVTVMKKDTVRLLQTQAEWPVCLVL